MKRYESEQGPTLGIGGKYSYVSELEDFSLGYYESNNECNYKIDCLSNQYTFPTTNTLSYLYVRYGGIDKKFGYKKMNYQI